MSKPSIEVVPRVILSRAGAHARSRQCVGGLLPTSSGNLRIVFLFTSCETAQRFLKDSGETNWKAELLNDQTLLSWLSCAITTDGAEVAVVDPRAVGKPVLVRAFHISDLIMSLERATGNHPLDWKSFSLWFA